MRRTALSAILSCLLMTSCSVAPKVIPGNTQDSAMTLRLKKQLETPNNDQDTCWGWLLWYMPLLIIVSGWTYREFFVKKSRD